MYQDILEPTELCRWPAAAAADADALWASLDSLATLHVDNRWLVLTDVQHQSTLSHTGLPRTGCTDILPVNRHTHTHGTPV